MNPKDLKVGDEVLVRMKIVSEPKNYDCRYGFEINGLPMWGEDGKEILMVPPENIYSLAPEFNPGEEVEFRKREDENWVKGIFIAHTPTNSDWPYIAAGMIRYKYARKIQPEKKRALIHINGLGDVESVRIESNNKIFKLVEVKP